MANPIVTGITPQEIDGSVASDVTIDGTNLDTVTSVVANGIVQWTGYNSKQATLTLTDQTPSQITLTLDPMGDPSWTAYYWQFQLNGPSTTTTRFHWQFPRSLACPTAAYFNVEEISGQDQANADLLAGLGFVADPASAWSEGEYVVITPQDVYDDGYLGNSNAGFQFNWNGHAWTSGPATPPQGGSDVELPLVLTLIPPEIKVKHGDTREVEWIANAELSTATVRLLRRAVPEPGATGTTTAVEVECESEDDTDNSTCVVIHRTDPELPVGSYFIEVEATFPDGQIATFPSDTTASYVVVSDLG